MLDDRRQLTVELANGVAVVIVLKGSGRRTCFVNYAVVYILIPLTLAFIQALPNLCAEVDKFAGAFKRS